jgi:hypothetical protein
LKRFSVCFLDGISLQEGSTRHSCKVQKKRPQAQIEVQTGVRKSKAIQMENRVEI